jgi:molybdopterin synthase catalytic subunit
VQRIGKLEIGESTTIVVCAAAHRDQGAFDAARYGIDRLKEIVPVWKKEIGQDHSIWIEGHYRPTEQDN